MKHKFIQLIRLRNIRLIIVGWLRRMPAEHCLRWIALYTKTGISVILIAAFAWHFVPFGGHFEGSKWGQVDIENPKRYKDYLRPRAAGERSSKIRPGPVLELMEIASEVTGSRIFYPDTETTWSAGWFANRIREMSGYGPEEYLGRICDEEGRLRNEHREEAEAIFNNILLLFPTDPKGVGIYTGLNREPGQFSYFERVILPSLIAEKLKEGKKALGLKVIGCSTGEEMATVYYYAKRAFEAHPEWGRLEEWGIEISGIDISAYAVREAAKRLLASPKKLESLFLLKTEKDIIGSIQKISRNQRRKIFKLKHGNIVYGKDRGEFMRGVDVVFVNVTLHQIVSGPRAELIRDILAGNIWICTGHDSVYGQCPQARSAIEVEETMMPNSYIIAPSGVVLAQPEIKPFMVPHRLDEYEDAIIEHFDNPGDLLPTHQNYHSYFFRRPDYDRANHVAALIQAIDEGRFRLSPSVMKGLEFIAADKKIPRKYKECRRFAAGMLEACAIASPPPQPIMPSGTVSDANLRPALESI